MLPKLKVANAPLWQMRDLSANPLAYFETLPSLPSLPRVPRSPFYPNNNGIVCVGEIQRISICVGEIKID